MIDVEEKELADKSALKYFGKAIELVDVQKLGLYKDGFLAGLKAGRPQWHFVSKEGFPSKDDIYLIIRNDGLHLGDYCCGGDGDIDCQGWCDYPSEEEIQDDSVIAWCEIPTFDKE